MTEHDLESRLRDAQRAEADQADPGALLERVDSIPERVGPQRRHWWSGLRGGAGNGTSRGGGSSSRRQNHMILATSIAGVAVVALGGVFAISGIDDRQGVAPVPGAQQVQGPVAFSGGFRPGLCDQEATIEVVGFVTQQRGYSCQPLVVAMTDDRLSGIATWSSSTDSYLGEGFAVEITNMTIENEDGIWRQVPRVALDLLRSIQAGPYVFIGEGGYDGLIAIAQVERGGSGGDDLSGFIIEADLPPAPEIR